MAGTASEIYPAIVPGQKRGPASPRRVPTWSISSSGGTCPAAIANRRQLPETIRALQLLIGSGIKGPLQFFVDIILPRDMWMHRMEIALATALAIVRAGDHEGRPTALVLRDLSHRLTPVLGKSSVTYRLTGPDGGAFRFGWETTPRGDTQYGYGGLPPAGLRPALP